MESPRWFTRGKSIKILDLRNLEVYNEIRHGTSKNFPNENVIWRPYIKQPTKAIH